MLCLAAVIALFCGSAMAATATTTEYSLGTIFAKLSLADSYIVLREENLESHEEIQHALNTTAEGMKQDWQERGPDDAEEKRPGCLSGDPGEAG